MAGTGEGDGDETARLRAEVESLHRVIATLHEISVSIRCSLGAAVLPGRAEDRDGLLRAADDALLRAKREGKNRVCLA